MTDYNDCSSAPEALQLADWRRHVCEMYDAIRTEPDPRRAWGDWVAVRDQLFRDHPQSPIDAGARAAFGGLSRFPYDPSWRLAVDVEAADGDTLELDCGADGPVQLRPAAVTHGLAGKLGRELIIYRLAGYGGGLLLPFRDATAGVETYGGGRYLLDTVKGADLGLAPDGRLRLDFNFAYHPSCAHDARWVCPLAPLSNHVDVAVSAGERL